MLNPISGDAGKDPKTAPGPIRTSGLSCAQTSTSTRLPGAPVRRRWSFALGLGAWLALSSSLLAADFLVTTPGGQFAFNINGSNSPTLTLVRGRTYTFEVSTTPDLHPFHIQSPGVMNNDITTGTMTYKVPTNAVNYSYYCTFHGLSMQGSIITTAAPPPPPPIRIVGLSVGTNLVLWSTGTNNYRVLPEFKSEVIGSNWTALSVQTNRHANGTNETHCVRPSANPVFIRVKAVEQ